MIKIILAVTNDIVTDNRVHKIATTLTSNGYSVTIVGRKLEQSTSLLNRSYRTRRFRLWFNKSMLFYANYNLMLFIYLLKTPVHIIVSNDLDTLLSCWLASKLRRKTLVFDSHELFSEVPELVDRPLVKNIWKAFENMIIPGIKLGYTVSKPIQDYYKAKYKKEFLLVRNVSMFRYDNSFKSIPENYIIIYQGAVNKGRGLELMLETMCLLENATLWIVGNGDILTDLKNLAEKLKVIEKVVFFGRVPLEKLSEITSKAHVGISLEEDMGLNYRFALPNKLFDYIQARIPLVVSALPEMKSLVTDNNIGFVLENRTPEILAEIFKNLQKDIKVQEVISQNLELAARDLCWQREEQKIIELYHEASALIRGHIA